MGSSFCGYWHIIVVFGIAMPSVWPLAEANCWYRGRKRERVGEEQFRERKHFVATC